MGKGMFLFTVKCMTVSQYENEDLEFPLHQVTLSILTRQTCFCFWCSMFLRAVCYYTSQHSGLALLVFTDILLSVQASVVVQVIRKLVVIGNHCTRENSFLNFLLTPILPARDIMCLHICLFVSIAASDLPVVNGIVPQRVWSGTPLVSTGQIRSVQFPLSN